MKIGLEPVTIKSSLYDVNEIRRAMDNTLTQTARSIKVDFKVTTQTWTDKPNFRIQLFGRWQRIIGTSNLIYKFVSGGTRVRYATMTQGFRPKTRTRYIGSNKGRGGLAYVNTKKPRPGIKARKFDEEIAKKWKKLLPAIVERALLTELTKRG